MYKNFKLNEISENETSTILFRLWWRVIWLLAEIYTWAEMAEYILCLTFFESWVISTGVTRFKAANRCRRSLACSSTAMTNASCTELPISHAKSEKERGEREREDKNITKMIYEANGLEMLTQPDNKTRQPRTTNHSSSSNDNNNKVLGACHKQQMGEKQNIHAVKPQNMRHYLNSYSIMRLNKGTPAWSAQFEVFAHSHSLYMFCKCITLHNKGVPLVNMLTVY